MNICCETHVAKVSWEVLYRDLGDFASVFCGAVVIVRKVFYVLAWKHLSGKVLESKHKQKGIAQRAGLLKGGVRNINGLEIPAVPDGARMDDVLDAVVGLWTADCIVGGGGYNRRLPEEEPARDERGLRMEIWF